jgi:hypothetical protein
MPVSKGGTTLVVCPDLYPHDFIEYLGIYNILVEGILVDQNLTGVLQVVPFHPLFEFAGGGYDAAAADDDDDNFADVDDPVMANDNDIADGTTMDQDRNQPKDVSNSSVTIENYTNRSPYPTFHILREVEVTKAVKTLGGDASRVWKRNIELLQDLEQEFIFNPNNNNNDDDDDEDDRHLLLSVILKGKTKDSIDTAAVWKRVEKVVKERNQKRSI